jgi:hypothetical protein
MKQSVAWALPALGLGLIQMTLGLTLAIFGCIGRKPKSRCEMISRATFSGCVIGFLCLSTQIEAQPASSDLFLTACRDRMPNIQEDRRVCIVGIVHDGKDVDVLLSTRADLAGRRLAVYGSSVVQPGLASLKEISNLIERIVVLGGFVDGSAIYSAKLL